jgi:regulator of protease activity HflC (stomatin/prohibitin superfamily)
VEQRLDAIVDSSVRRVLGGATLVDILSESRSELTASIREEVNESANSLGLEIIDVRIRRADYPDATSQNIFNRMKSEREREAKEFRATGEEEAQKIRADADKQRTVMVADARRQSEILLVRVMPNQLKFMQTPSVRTKTFSLSIGRCRLIAKPSRNKARPWCCLRIVNSSASLAANLAKWQSKTI